MICLKIRTFVVSATTLRRRYLQGRSVVICLKIRTFVVSATTSLTSTWLTYALWFAWKFVPLWYQQQLGVVWITESYGLWFAWKFVPLWYQQQQMINRCMIECVVICLKIRTFVVSATTGSVIFEREFVLWFAWKFVPLWYQQQQHSYQWHNHDSCDLLENSYLCGISNNSISGVGISKRVVICLKIRTFVVSATTSYQPIQMESEVVICLKIRTFVVSATTSYIISIVPLCCDLLENSYLCGISNNERWAEPELRPVVICLKIRTFVVSATTMSLEFLRVVPLWFAWKFVPLWYQQQPAGASIYGVARCDLLENSYLCGISNNCQEA